VKENVDKLVRNILKNYGPERIVLFGSRARGDEHEGSDVDLMLIKETGKRFIDRAPDVIKLNNTPLSLDPVIYTRAEFSALIAEKNSFAMAIQEEGVVLYG
jgi:predicted nucleotidyltransferase